MSLLKALEVRDSTFQPYLSTNTLYDLQTGVFIPGVHGGMILNGGLSRTNGYMGRQQRFKSTIMMSHITRAMSYYPGSESYTDDTEDALKKERVIAFSPFDDNHANLDERMVITTSAETSAEEFFDQIKKLAQMKISAADSYTVESPLIDPRTMQRVRMFIPTFVCFDSWSKLISAFMQTTLDTKALGSSDTNTIFMKDGAIKKMMMTQIPTLAARAGIYFFLSAHIGDVIKIDPYASAVKSLQYMRSSDKPKEVGSDFLFLVSNVVEMRNVDLMLDTDKKDALYPIVGGSATDLNEVTLILSRCKNNASGSQLPIIVSPSKGILSALTNYHYIRSNKYFGLIGSQVIHKPAMTDNSVGRTTIREKLTDQKTARAIEILAQFRYIKANWVTAGVDVNFNTYTPEQLAEDLLGSGKAMVNDILESRGWWTYDKTNLQPYLSTYDVLAIAQGLYRAKGVSLAGMTVPQATSETQQTV